MLVYESSFGFAPKCLNSPLFNPKLPNETKKTLSVHQHKFFQTTRIKKIIELRDNQFLFQAKTGT